jgi:hypothetical protein
MFLNSGRIGVTQSRKALLVLSTDNRSQPVAYDILIEIGCAPPD